MFYDPILSGNRNISCGTCHHHDFGSSDGLSLGIGEGGQGVGPNRRDGKGPNQIKKRIPRNSPGLWNLGAKEFETLFHDGRLSIAETYDNGFNSPAREWLPAGLNGLLAAQALFPLTSQFEMAGSPGENDIAGAAHDRIDYVWPIIAKRVRGIPAYRELFQGAYDIQPADISIVQIANALADFVNAEWRSFDSRYDAYLAGLDTLSADELAGKELFFGEAGCSSCHSGPFFTDHRFHALALPPFGPGRTRSFDPIVHDVGRMAETDRLEDAYRFRTPSLRNVELTAPYGHNGAYPSLQGIVRHHLDPLRALKDWRPEWARLPKAERAGAVDFLIFDDRFEMARIATKIDIEPIPLSEREIAQLENFLKTLTGTYSRYGRLGRPDQVPSGLRVDRADLTSSSRF